MVGDGDTLGSREGFDDTDGDNDREGAPVGISVVEVEFVEKVSLTALLVVGFGVAKGATVGGSVTFGLVVLGEGDCCVGLTVGQTVGLGQVVFVLFEVIDIVGA